MRKAFAGIGLIVALAVASLVTQHFRLPHSIDTDAFLNAQGYSGAAPVVSPHSGTSLRAVYTAGTITYGGGTQAITADATGLLTTDSKTDCTAPAYASCNFIYWTSSTSLATTTVLETAFKPGNVVVAFVTTAAGDITAAIPASRNISVAPNVRTDRFFYVSPAGCSDVYTTTAADTGFPKWATAATGEALRAFQTDTTAGTVTLTCPLMPPGSLSTSGTGMTVTGIDVIYGITTTTLTSVTDPVVYSITAPATAGGAAAGTVSNTALGTLTLLPTTGTWQGTAVTSGLLYRGSITAGTPLAINSPNVHLGIKLAFVTQSVAPEPEPTGLLGFSAPAPGDRSFHAAAKGFARAPRMASKTLIQLAPFTVYYKGAAF